MNFEELGLGSNVLKAIEECGYTEPTPIQEATIPSILMTRDVIGLAQTGTGKTASFILPMIEVLHGGRAKARMPRSLVLSPTRELAAQIAKNFDTYGKYHKLTMALLTGGTSMGDQMKLLDRGVDVLIATPGRLIDLFERGSILLNDIKIFVIDEADRMLDMGFIPDIEKIVSLVPPIRQTLLFSATMPPEIEKLGKKFLSNPKSISVAPPASPADTVEQFLVKVHKKDKEKTLESLIKKENVSNALIFCNRKRDADALTRWLKKRDHNVAAMHGDMAQSARTQTLQDFKDDKITLLVCSDVAARGIDIAGLSHVFNFDVPYNADDYVHRIGRTGRAGMDGRAWTIATRDDDKFIDAIEKLIGKKLAAESPASQDKEEKDGKDGKGGRGGDQKQRQSRDNRKNKADKKDDHRQPSKSQHQNKKHNNRHNHEDDSNGPGFGDDMPAFFKQK